MVGLAVIGISVFALLLGLMAWTAGTQPSISALVTRWRWLLLAVIWSQVTLLPVMLEITPDGWQWLAALGVFCLALTGCASLKIDARVHTIAAIAGFTLLAAWVIVMDYTSLLPAVVCIAAGGSTNWKWRLEVGLIISVYMTVIHQLI